MANYFKVEKFSSIKVTGLHSEAAKEAFKDMRQYMSEHKVHLYVETGPDQFILTENVSYIKEEE